MRIIRNIYLLTILAIASLSASAESPSQLFLFGNFNGFKGDVFQTTADADNCLQFEQTSSGVFEIKNLWIGQRMISDGTLYDYGRFMIGTQWGQDRFSIAAGNVFYKITYNPKENPMWPAYENAEEYRTLSVNNSNWEFYLGSGIYDMKVDFTTGGNGLLYLTNASGEAEYATLYLHGADTSGRASGTLQFDKDADGRMVCRNVSVMAGSPVYISTRETLKDDSPCFKANEDGIMVKATTVERGISLLEGTYDFIVTPNGAQPTLEITNSTSTYLPLPEASGASTEYYTPAGLRVSPTAPGIYIRAEGSRRTKVIVR